jgi:hypothetical protein
MMEKDRKEKELPELPALHLLPGFGSLTKRGSKALQTSYVQKTVLDTCLTQVPDTYFLLRVTSINAALNGLRRE